jgi:putative transposase
MIRTYPVKHYENMNKKTKILKLSKEYRILAKSISCLQWKEFYKTGNLNKNLDIKELDSHLSERYKQTCQYQVVGVLKSWLSNRQKEFVRIVYHSNLPEDVKIKLFYINKYKKWFIKEVKMRGNLIEKDIIKLSRKIIKEVIKRHRLPELKHCNLALDNKVAKISIKADGANSFDYWIKLSTLDYGNPIYIPIKTNEYFESKKGILKKFCQINIDRDSGSIDICLIKDIPSKKEDYIPATPQIGIDLGLRNLFSLSDGSRYGVNFIEKIRHYDNIITEIMQNRQRQGLNPKSKKYKRAVKKFRKYLKNEIHRLLNSIIERYKPGEIVIEKLNFRNPDLSKRMNRLLSVFGKSIIKDYFSSIEELYGIKIKEINPAYTSQTCSRCGYIDKHNRKCQSVFICQYCRKKIHADVNASRNHLLRSSQKKLSNIYSSRDNILRELVIQFFERNPGVHSYANHLLVSNLYFTRFKDELRDKWKIFL